MKMVKIKKQDRNVIRILDLSKPIEKEHKDFFNYIQTFDERKGYWVSSIYPTWCEVVEDGWAFAYLDDDEKKRFCCYDQKGLHQCFQK